MRFSHFVQKEKKDINESGKFGEQSKRLRACGLPNVKLYFPVSLAVFHDSKSSWKVQLANVLSLRGKKIE